MQEGLTHKLKLLNHDTMFYSNPDSIIINKETLVSTNLSEDFTKNIFSDMSKDVSFVPICKCGELVGEAFIGITCKICNSKVSTEFSNRLSHTNWIHIPDIFPSIINPLIYEMLRKWGEPIRYRPSIIDVILNPEFKYPDDFNPKIKGKGFRYFYDNFDMIMEYLLTEYPSTANRKNNHEVRNFINLYRDDIFCRHLPILDSSLHPISKSGSMKYVDKTSKDVLLIATDLTYGTFMKRKGMMRSKNIDKMLYQILTSYHAYISNLAKNKLGDKLAIIRHHTLGSRLHFTCRSVIVPHTYPHIGDEVYFPWRIAINIFKLEVWNHLVNRHNFRPRAANELIFKACASYDPLIDRIFKDIIDECPYKGLPFLIGRNPTYVGGISVMIYCIPA